MSLYLRPGGWSQSGQRSIYPDTMGGASHFWPKPVAFHEGAKGRPEDWSKPVRNMLRVDVISGSLFCTKLEHFIYRKGGSQKENVNEGLSDFPSYKPP